MLALATASLSFNVAVRPSLAVSRVAQPKMGLVADIKDAVLPSNTDSTLRNVMGYQMTGWGVGATVRMCIPPPSFGCAPDAPCRASRVRAAPPLRPPSAVSRACAAARTHTSGRPAAPARQAT